MRIRCLCAAVCSLALLAAACATPTPYQPYVPEATSRIHGGYSSQRLAEERYVVRFHGNELTSRDRVENYMLYRAAELALDQGYDGFRIIDRHTEQDIRTYNQPDTDYRPYFGTGYGYWRPHWRYYQQGLGWDVWHPEWDDHFWYDRVDSSRIESFEAEALIELLRGPLPADQPGSFDARRVVADLGPGIKRPQP